MWYQLKDDDEYMHTDQDGCIHFLSDRYTAEAKNRTSQFIEGALKEAGHCFGNGQLRRRLPRSRDGEEDEENVGDDKIKGKSKAKVDGDDHDDDDNDDDDDETSSTTSSVGESIEDKDAKIAKQASDIKNLKKQRRRYVQSAANSKRHFEPINTELSGCLYYIHG